MNLLKKRVHDVIREGEGHDPFAESYKSKVGLCLSILESEVIDLKKETEALKLQVFKLSRRRARRIKIKGGA
jgi:hypothetical protein